MKTITVNRKSFKISHPLARAIRTIAERGPRAISDFTERRGRRFENPVNLTASTLERETAGAITRLFDAQVDEKLRASRPRVQKWIVPTSRRRVNLVFRKLVAAGAYHDLKQIAG